MDPVNNIRIVSDALIGLHTKFEKNVISKAELTVQVMNLSKRITEEADSMEATLKAEAMEKDAKIRGLQKKIVELQTYNGKLSASLSKAKTENASLHGKVLNLSASQEAWDELFVEMTPGPNTHQDSRSAANGSTNPNTLLAAPATPVDTKAQPQSAALVMQGPSTSTPTSSPQSQDIDKEDGQDNHSTPDLFEKSPQKKKQKS